MTLRVIRHSSWRRRGRFLGLPFDRPFVDVLDRGVLGAEVAPQSASPWLMPAALAGGGDRMSAAAGNSGSVREVRIALVCYGGVSLAIYMHGVTRELHRLVVASGRFEEPNPSSRRVVSMSIGSSCTSWRPRMESEPAWWWT
jgi:hypothetical protein